MSNHPFVHLHNHTQYSLLDGAQKIDEMIERAVAFGMKSVAITDHGNMFGAIEFYKACKETKKSSEKDGLPPLKPIIGMEAYIVPNGVIYDGFIGSPGYQIEVSHDPTNSFYTGFAWPRKFFSVNSRRI